MKQPEITRLSSAARKVWRYSANHSLVRNRCKDPNKTGWWICEKCNTSVEVIKVDHIKPIGKGPTEWKDFGWWLPKLNCPITNLQDLCTDCHKDKTKKERKKKS